MQMNKTANIQASLQLVRTGYVAGDGDGIVTVGGVPASCYISVLNTHDLSVVQHVLSYKNGHYLIANLNPNQKYLIMARDYKGEYEPCVWDNVIPMNDKTLAEQMELHQSWQG